ncbi:hypothetical protein [Dyadobacter sp. MSC1_007]
MSVQQLLFKDTQIGIDRLHSLFCADDSTSHRIPQSRLAFPPEHQTLSY